MTENSTTNPMILIPGKTGSGKPIAQRITLFNLAQAEQEAEQEVADADNAANPDNSQSKA